MARRYSESARGEPACGESARSESARGEPVLQLCESMRHRLGDSFCAKGYTIITPADYNPLASRPLRRVAAEVGADSIATGVLLLCYSGYLSV